MSASAAVNVNNRDDEAAARHRAAFLGHMRRVPGAVAIIATQIGDERTGLVATAWNSLCADPPMLLACVNRAASAYPLVQRARAFSVNLLALDHEEAVAIFSARRGLEGSARFNAADWTLGEHGQPMFNAAVAAFECTLEATHDYGTHTILIGKVETMRAADDARAMLYLDGCFASAVASPKR